MKKIFTVLLITMLMLCSCSATAKAQLKLSESYDIVLEEDQKITLELLNITKDYFEIEITKEKTDGYFNIKTQTYDGTITRRCDVAFVDQNNIIDYVMVNDSERVEKVDFSGGIQYGVPYGFAIDSFEGSTNLKFYFYSNDTVEYAIEMFTKTVRDYEITKVNETGNREIDSVIQAIALEIK